MKINLTVILAILLLSMPSHAQTASSRTDSLKAVHQELSRQLEKIERELTLEKQTQENLQATTSAVLTGRRAIGGLPSPSCAVQKYGTVTVAIWVDQYGTVQKAQAGSEGTTVMDKTLWAAARKAALSTHFNIDADAPALQQGTITYTFKKL